ncbi:DUF732 domain-containing protein [Rhodococcoides fascians]|uniref:DUF732 domain-containing protein n=1 Tax=Rhodococcoides fascians TaxID=1828 RepID=UPI0009B8477C|nr:DUF732 domain-containing protein [Rhodococcus fascians]
MSGTRFRVLATVSFGSLLFAGAAACSTTPEPPPQATATSSLSASTPTSSSAPTATYSNTREEFGDLQFLLTVRDAGVAGSDAALVGAAQDICTGIRAEGVATSTELFALLRENLVDGIEMIDAVSVATAGILHYCPEHSGIIGS